MKKIVALAAALLLTAHVASAQITIDVKTDMTKGVVTVNGKCDTPGDYIYLQVLKPGKSVEDLSDSDLTAGLFYTDDTNAGTNSEYSIEIAVDDAPSGDYLFRIRAKSEPGFVEKSVNIIGLAEINDMLDTINNAQSDSDDDLVKLVNDDFIYNILGVEDKLVSFATNRSLVCENIYNAKVEAPYTVDKLTDLKELIRESMVVSVINMHNLNSQMLMNEYADEISFRGDTAADKVYDEIFNENQKSGFMQSIGDGNLKSYEQLCSIYPEEVFFYAVKNCAWQFLAGIVKNYSEKLPEIKIDEYEALKDSHGAAELVTGKDFLSFPDFIQAFNDAVKTQKDKENQTNVEQDDGNNGNGGSGGSGGGNRTAEVAPSVPVEIPKVEEVVFNDIESVPWAAEAIKNLASKQIICGVEVGVFAPDNTITREEFLKIFVGAFDLYQEFAKCNFDDVDKNAWYYPYIATACESGMVSGIGNNLFGTGRNITRQEVCLILYRNMKDKLPLKYSEDMKVKFSDTENLSAEAAEAVTVLSYNGIINGIGNGNFAPYDNMTRAQAAVIINNAIK